MQKIVQFFKKHTFLRVNNLHIWDFCCIFAENLEKP